MVLILLSVLAFQPAFEVASVKPTPPGARIIGDLVSMPGGRVVATNCKLEQLIEEALAVQPFQVRQGVGWLREDSFDIDAKPPASSMSSKEMGRRRRLNDEQRRMLETLLVDRFHLKYHRVTRQGPVYLLVKTNKKLVLHQPEDLRAAAWVGSPNNGVIRGDGIAGINVSMAGVAARLSAYLERPVLDRTGIKGTFDFKFETAPDSAHPDVVSSILYCVQQLGLKLESGRGPVETIVIDHADRPSEN